MAQINEWLSIDNASGTGDATITLTASSSTELTERMASLEIKGVTKSVYVSITQDAFVAPPSTTEYFWIKLEEDGDIQGLRTTFEYSYDQINWQSSPTTLSVPANTYVWFRNTSPILNAENTSAILFTKRGSVGGDLSSMGDMMAYNFQKLFKDNTYLVDASELILPWNTLANYCYKDMFYGCTSLVNAPELPATTLQMGCYNRMFYKCTSLETAPELPATTLAKTCYDTMFYYCTSLVNAPELPATTLAENCYYSMFYGCTSLETAPELPATTLVDYCYYQMFHGCTNLNYIKILATSYINPYYCLNSWVYGVGSTGTFIKKQGVTYPSGSSGIPEGWTIQEIANKPTDIENCFYIEPADSSYNGTYTIWSADNSGVENNGWDRIRFYYYQDNTWKEFRCKKSLNELNYLSVSGRVYIKDYYRKIINAIDWRPLNCSIEFNVGGDITTLLGAIENPIEPYDVYGKGKGNYYAFSLFRYSNIYSAKELIFPDKTYEDCYSFMFADCSKLVFPPNELPATTLTESCYSNMFSDCTALTTAPVLPATTLVDYCYYWMFQGCTSLTTAPILPATILAKWCYISMFKNCSNLSRVECHAEVINADDYCLSDWLVNVSPTGTFIKKQGASYESGNSGIPRGWSVQEIA